MLNKYSLNFITVLSMDSRLEGAGPIKQNNPQSPEPLKKEGKGFGKIFKYVKDTVSSGKINKEFKPAQENSSLSAPIPKHKLSVYKSMTKKLDKEGRTIVTLTKISYKHNPKGEKITRSYVANPAKIVGMGASATVFLLQNLEKGKKNKAMLLSDTHDLKAVKQELDDLYTDSKGKIQQLANVMKPIKMAGVDKKKIDYSIESLYASDYTAQDVQPKNMKELWSDLGQVANGIKNLHDRGRTHGDFKSENILVRYAKTQEKVNGELKDRKIKVLDIADLKDIDTVGVIKVGTTHTAPYITPGDLEKTGEIAADIERGFVDKHVTELKEGTFRKSKDVYALGITFREKITKAPLNSFLIGTHRNSEGKYESSRIQRPLEPQDIHPDFTSDKFRPAELQNICNFINRMTDSDPDKRPTIDEVAEFTKEMEKIAAENN